MEAIAERLASDGYVVIPLPPGCAEAARDCVRAFDGPRPFPEKTTPGMSRYPLPEGRGKPVEPGFGCCPLPSSMHRPESRALHGALRSQVFEPLALALVSRVPEVRGFLGEGRAAYFAYLYDRWCQRSPGVKPTKEAVHRDLCPDAFSAARNSLVFGGFVAAEGDQMFTCYRATHVVGRPDASAGIGFATLSKSDAARIRGDMADRRAAVAVPEGHALVFFENILHEVVGRGYRHRMTRLFTAFSVWSGAPPCPASGCRCPDPQGRDCYMCIQVACCREGSLTHVKSKQQNRTYPRLYACNHREKLRVISEQLPAIAPPGGFDPAALGSRLPCSVHPPVELALPYSEEELAALAGVDLRAS